MREVPVLPAGQYLLRAWTWDDLEFASRAAADPNIARYSSVGVAVAPEATKEWIESRRADDRLDWVIESSGAAIGRVSLAHIDDQDQVAEVGYWVLAPYRRRRVADTALDAVESHAFSVLDLYRLYIRHEPENVASCAVANSRGYVAEGTQRGAFTRAGARRDLHVHALLISDGPPTAS